MKKWDIIGILAGIGGMILIVGAINSTEERTLFGIIIGDILAIISALTASLALVYIRKITSETLCPGKSIFWSV